MYIIILLVSDGSDFNGTETELQFTPALQTNCIDIGIVDDTIVEGTEVFTVTVSSTDPVGFSSDSVIVSIIDNQDSTLHYPCAVNCVCNFSLSHSGVIVGFLDSSYNVSEGSIHSVCVELSGTLQRNVIVSVTIYGTSATGEIECYL